MVEEIIRKTPKKVMYKWSIYINVILFFLVALITYFIVIDSIDAGKYGGDEYLNIVRDVAFLAVVLAFIFYQFFKNIFTIMKRSL